ncbi:Holliday junction resolvase RuvX [Pontivivens ytuae]|uniref:Putative pre-16S rRNA nuclease n=2 Tax=Pontivivens ytuae TaxID=2789856 RepID=A0A7S9LQY8_9RHOB|nr:Holliday junction resolvase RuvX [Pontivivens ytuae]
MATPDPRLPRLGRGRSRRTGHGRRARRLRWRRSSPRRTGGNAVSVYEDVAEFRSALPATGALMGLDLGTKTIGLALSDGLRGVATAMRTHKRTKFGVDAQALLAAGEERQVTGIVLGLPRNMDGSEGPRAQSTRAFARNLMGLTELPITFWDERLSTIAAERALLAADASRARRAEVIDSVAASYILQGLLDRLHHMEHDDER